MADSSLVEAVISGFVEKKENANSEYEPTLIVNHDGRTMEKALKEELERSQDFDMSVAFVSQGAVQTLKQHFLDFADNNNQVALLHRHSTILILRKHSKNC